MVNTNAIGFTFIALYMIGMGQVIEFIMMCETYPLLLPYLIMIGTCLSIAVYAYTRLIQESGSVFAVSIATLRKVATMILSYIVFPKPLSYLHMISGVFVLGGIMLSSYTPKHRK